MGHINRESLSGFSMNGHLHVEDLPPQLDSGEQYEIPGDKGRYLLVSRKDLISIRKIGDQSVHLKAEINERGHVEWRLYTRKFLPIKPDHDLRAGLFYDAAMAYLFVHGNDTDIIGETWNAGTINHIQYRHYLKNVKNDPEQALYSTWSWQKAQEHGFNRYEAESGMGLDVFTYAFLFYR